MKISGIAKYLCEENETRYVSSRCICSRRSRVHI